MLTIDETLTYLTACQAYTASEFGDADAFSVNYLLQQRNHGVQFYRAFGDFTTLPPRILGIANCMFISYPMLAAMQTGERKEKDLDPWTPDDGPAILWIAAVVSDMPGIAAKCLSAAIEDFEKHPNARKADRIGLVCTGPEGYIMGHAFGMETSGETYHGDWLFMYKALSPEMFDSPAQQVSTAWSTKAVRNAIGEGRQRWGRNWKRARLLPNTDRIA